MGIEFSDEEIWKSIGYRKQDNKKELKKTKKKNSQDHLDRTLALANDFNTMKKI